MSGGVFWGVCDLIMILGSLSAEGLGLVLGPWLWTVSVPDLGLVSGSLLCTVSGPELRVVSRL